MYYVVKVKRAWTSLVDGTGQQLAGVIRGGIGYLPVYDDIELARRDWPEAEIELAEVTPPDAAAGEPHA